MNNKKPAKIKKTLARTLVFLGFFVYVGYTVIVQQININNKKAELSAINSQIEVVKEERNALAAEKERVNTPEYIEQYARTELGYAAPDEIVFIDSTFEN